jgi:hypothetical protein
MTNDTITIEKGKYRALLMRVLRISPSEDGENLEKVVRDRVKDLASSTSYTPSVQEINEMFLDLELLRDFYVLEKGLASSQEDSSKFFGH